ncbi:MAG: MBL fold metallo-hydrolase [Lachnospiraceae bacterium]|nr:MBL fold metallo-hydrolase [Lachnospiraceae bacterium]
MEYHIDHYIVGPVATNCYILVNEDAKEAVVVDPGAAAGPLHDKIVEDGYTPVAILLTHGHFDHAGGVSDLVSLFPDRDIPVYAYKGERQTLEDPKYNLSGNMGVEAKRYSATDYLEDDEVFEVAGFRIKLLFTPGHTPGGCCFYLEDQKLCFTGDTLFNGSVGRTDFYGGSMSELVRSINEKLLTLPDDTTCYPGHDSLTTIGDERVHNPFL